MDDRLNDRYQRAIKERDRARDKLAALIEAVEAEIRYGDEGQTMAYAPGVSTRLEIAIDQATETKP